MDMKHQVNNNDNGEHNTGSHDNHDNMVIDDEDDDDNDCQPNGHSMMTIATTPTLQKKHMQRDLSSTR